MFTELHQELPGVQEGGPDRRAVAGQARVLAAADAQAPADVERGRGGAAATGGAGATAGGRRTGATAAEQLLDGHVRRDERLLVVLVRVVGLNYGSWRLGRRRRRRRRRRRGVATTLRGLTNVLNDMLFRFRFIDGPTVLVSNEPTDVFLGLFVVN